MKAVTAASAAAPPFFRVMLPLSRNGIITVVILAFVAIWNDYLTALVLLPDQQNRTLSVALAFAKDEYRVDYGMMSAAIDGCGQSVPHIRRSGLARSSASWNGLASG